MGKQAAKFLWQADIDFFLSGNWNSPCFLTRQSFELHNSQSNTEKLYKDQGQ